ncbi:MAG: type II toxin-antitoxin system RelE/ParE family toxin [Planctomycetes bacterium]|nr:type II toxin-antitoxin system RelE/ParE family toxin [Planctomycetota bacterium]
MYLLEIAGSARRELAEIRAFERTAIAREIQEQLTREPTVPTRKRKLLEGVKPTFEAKPPVWELRIGEIRVFYDVDEGTMTVFVRAIRWKPPHKTTEEIL